MSLVSTVLNGARYDLRNYSDIDFDSDQMIHYLNRALKTLDYTLANHNSDWSLNKGTVTLSSGNSYTSVPTLAFNIREIWIDDDRLENLDQMELFYKSEFRESETTQPNYWTHKGDTIQFEVTADQDYTITVYYDKLSTPITSESGTMPYEGRFDDALRESIVLMAESKKYKNPQQADAAYAQIFATLVHHDVLNRKFIKKNYRLDF